MILREPKVPSAVRAPQFENLWHKTLATSWIYFAVHISGLSLTWMLHVSEICAVNWRLPTTRRIPATFTRTGRKWLHNVSQTKCFNLNEIMHHSLSVPAAQPCEGILLCALPVVPYQLILFLHHLEEGVCQPQNNLWLFQNASQRDALWGVIA